MQVLPEQLVRYEDDVQVRQRRPPTPAAPAAPTAPGGWHHAGGDGEGGGRPALSTAKPQGTPGALALVAVCRGWCSLLLPLLLLLLVEGCRVGQELGGEGVVLSPCEGAITHVQGQLILPLREGRGGEGEEEREGREEGKEVWVCSVWQQPVSNQARCRHHGGGIPHFQGPPSIPAR